MTACRGCGAALRLPYDPPGTGRLHKASLHCVDCWNDDDTRNEHARRLALAQAERKGRSATPTPRAKHVPLTNVMEEWANWRGTYTPDEVARMLRMSYGTFYRAIHRARAAGDPRADGFPGRHGLMDPSRRLRTSSWGGSGRRSW